MPESRHPAVDRRRRTVENHNNHNNASHTSDARFPAFWKATQSTVEAPVWTRAIARGVWAAVEGTKATPLQSKDNLDDNDNDNSTKVFLQHHAKAILNSCRTLVKTAVTKDGDDSPALSSTARERHLHVALYGLRAVWTKCQRDTVLRLLYHCTVTFVDPEDGNMAYEALGRALDEYRVVIAAAPSIPTTAATTTNAKTFVLHTAKGSTFPLPHTRSTNTSKLKSAGGIAADQLWSMGILAVLANAKRLRLSSLVHTVAVPWIRASQSWGYAKKAHRLLWDLSNKKKEDGASSLSSSSLMMYRGDAIEVLLLDPSHYSAACSMVCQLVASAASERVPVSILHTFFEKLDAPIQALVQSADDSTAEGWSTSYLDYCCCRALHLGISDRPTTTPAVWSAPTRAFFDLYCRAVQVRDALRDTHSIENDNNDGLTKVVQGFHTHARSASLTTRTLWYKRLAPLKLHRLAYDRLSTPPAQTNNVDSVTWEAAAIVLCEGIGCLCFGLTEVSTNTQDGSTTSSGSLWAVAAECYKQGIAASPSDGPPRIRTLSRALTRAPVECVVNTAKFLSFLGKTRLSVSDSSRTSRVAAMVPLLHSVQLFLRVSTSPETFRSCQASNRLAYISSLYKSMEMVDEAILTIVLALQVEAVEASLAPPTQRSSDDVSMIKFLTGLTDHLICSPSQQDPNRSPQRTGLIKTLVRLMCERPRVEKDDRVGGSPSALKPGMTLDLLLKCSEERSTDSSSLAAELFEGACSIPFEMPNILQVMFTSKAFAVYNTSPSFTTVLEFEKARIFVDIMVTLAQRIREDSHKETTLSLVDYSSVCKLAEACLLKATTDSTSIRVMRAMLYTVASVSLSSRYHNNYFYAWHVLPHAKTIEDADTGELSLVGKAQIYSKKAHNLLHAIPKDKSDWGIAANVFFSAVDLHRNQLCDAKKKANGVCDIFSSLRATVEHVTSDRSHLSELNEISRECLGKLLGRLASLFSWRGLELQAFELAKWNVDIMDDTESQKDRWLESLLLSFLSSQSYLSMPASKELSCHFEKDPISMELYCCHLWNLATTLGDFDKIENVKSQLQLVQNEIGSLLGDVNLSLVYKWVGTTILLGLSECASRSGEIEQALYLVKECFKESKSLLVSIFTGRYDKDETDNRTKLSRVESVLFRSLPIRIIHRRAECLKKTAQFYCRLGDHRKTLEYARQVLHAENSLPEAVSEFKLAFTSFFKLTASRQPETCTEFRTRRFMLRVKAQTSSVELVSQSISCEEERSLFLAGIEGESGSTVLERVRDTNEVCDMLNGYQMQSYADPLELLSVTKDRLSQFITLPDITNFMSTAFCKADLGSVTVLPRLHLDMELKNCAKALSDVRAYGSAAEKDVMHRLREISASSAGSNLCRAWALYLLGSMALRDAKSKGDLRKLWENTLSSSESLDTARTYFSNSIQLIGSSCDLLKRDAMRAQALTTGPHSENDPRFPSSWQLINASVGVAACRKMVQAAEASYNNSTNESAVEAIRSLDPSQEQSFECFSELLAKHVPQVWRFVTAALCPTGELLMTSAEYCHIRCAFCYQSTCIFPDQADDSDDSEQPLSDMYDVVVKRLKKIVRASDTQLAQQVEVSIGSTKDERKREWWNARKAIDSELQSLLNDVQARLIQSDQSRRVLEGPQNVDRTQYEESKQQSLSGNLAARFDAVSSDDAKLIEKISSAMKVTELRSELLEYGIESKRLRKMRKAELCELLFIERNKKAGHMLTGDIIDPAFDFSTDRGAEPRERCIFLILDEKLQCFPFEGMQYFENKSVCRIPSVSFALLKLLQKNDSDNSPPFEFNPKRTSYILDPESNLGETRDRMLPCMKSLERGCNGQWENVVNTVPTSQFIEQSLSKKDGLLIYFGHGGGQQYITRRTIDILCRSNDSDLSSVILMGCSSGKLESVNEKDVTSTAQYPLHFEPEGIAMSYLLAGASSVVANLWDVTDHDIDRFSSSFLSRLFDSSSMSQSVADARAACKMRFIVGCAPVCYGFPTVRRG